MQFDFAQVLVLSHGIVLTINQKRIGLVWSHNGLLFAS